MLEQSGLGFARTHFELGLVTVGAVRVRVRVRASVRAVRVRVCAHAL